MQRLIILAAVSALAFAKPELYKEQEDFQYSRSSTDEGSKSGFYGAQRGNMGGNYERAHNMDSLAQNQMSGLVRQVEGELGDGANMRAGHVYTSANSKGVYGSGHFDLSNLAGRNFNEGTYNDNSQSHLSQSQTSSAQRSAIHASSNSHNHRHSGYRGYQIADAQTQTDDLHSLDNSQASNEYYNYGRHSGFHSQAGFQEHGQYANSNANLNSGRGSSNIRTRIISATPVRVVLTPGGRVAIPVTAQTYDATHGSSDLEQNAQNSNSMSFSGDNQGYIPSNAKHYESSYSYNKKWEKHDTIPIGFSIVPVTEEPIPQNSELLEDRDAHLQHNYDTRGLNSNSEHSSSASSGYSGVKSSRQSQYRTKYNSQYHEDTSNTNANLNNQFSNQAGANHGESLQSDLNANSHLDYTGSNSNLNSQVENLNTKPKSYHSSYSYHKSWERQGDPYVIKPASSGYYDSQASQRLTNQAYAAHQSGSHYSQNQADCDENGHIRIARSSYTDNKDMQQQNQNLDDSDDLTQQSANQYTGDLSQQSQTQWDQQDLGQQSQNRWENLEDLNQQSQNNWGQQSNLEQSNVEQQFQNQNQWNNFEELGQHSQTNLEQQNVGQESQNQWDTFENVGQQSDKNWGAFQQNTFDDITQQQQISDTNPESFRKHLQNFGGEHSQDTEQQQTHESHNKNTGISSDASQKELENKIPYEFENPWDKFDINDAHKERKPTIEQNIDINDFYWHHIPNNGMEDQRINKLNANGDIISGFGHRYPGPTVEHANEYPGFDNNYNPYVPYSYSNGFVNPTIYNKRDFYPENHKHVNSGNTHSWPTQGHENQDSQVNWQTHATDSNSFSQESTISSLWDKFDTIAKESHFSTGDLEYLPKQGENTFSMSNTHQSAESTSARINVSQIDGKMDISLDNQVTPKQETQTVSPKDYKHSVNDNELPEEIGNPNSKVPETSQDIGRGDIGADDSFSPSNIPIPYVIHDNVFIHDNTTQIVENNKNLRNISDNKKFNVLGLKTQEETKQNGDKIIISSHTNDTWGISNKNKSRNDSFELTNTNQNNKFHHDFKLSQQGHSNNLEVSETKLKDKETSEQDKENLQNEKLHFQNSQQQSLEMASQNVNKDHNIDDQYIQNIIHHQTNFEEQASHNIEHEQRQDFAEQNHDVEHQNLHYFDQQNAQNFGQQSENLEQNVQDFGEQNENVKQDFGQVSENFQQNIQDFGQQSENLEQNVHDFGQQSENFQQNIYDFGQQNENVKQDFGQVSENFQQNIQDFGQQSENLEQNVHDFGQQSENFQQNIYDFGQQNENVKQDFGQVSENFQQNIQDFGQQSENIPQNVQDFGQQSENFQQNIQDFRQKSENVQQNEQDLGQQSENLEKNRQDFGQKSNNVQQNVQDFGQQSENFDQNMQDFGQQSENILQNVQDFGLESNIRPLRHDTDSIEKQKWLNTDQQNLEPQFEQNFNHGNENQQSLQQENAHHIWTENEQLTQQHSQDFGQFSIQDFKLPKPNDGHQQYLNIDFPNEDLSYSDKLHQLENTKKEIQPEIIQERTAEQITEKINVQKQIPNVEYLQPNVVESENKNLESVTERATEKPGFWKSLGNKLTNAKNKVTSWFKS